MPALAAKPFKDDEALVPVDSMPEWAQPAFKGMKTLNRVQSRVYECAPPAQRMASSPRPPRVSPQLAAPPRIFSHLAAARRS